MREDGLITALISGATKDNPEDDLDLLGRVELGPPLRACMCRAYWERGFRVVMMRMV